MHVRCCPCPLYGAVVRRCAVSAASLVAVTSGPSGASLPFPSLPPGRLVPCTYLQTPEPRSRCPLAGSPLPPRTRSPLLSSLDPRVPSSLLRLFLVQFLTSPTLSSPSVSCLFLSIFPPSLSLFFSLQLLPLLFVFFFQSLSWSSAISVPVHSFRDHYTHWAPILPVSVPQRSLQYARLSRHPASPPPPSQLLVGPGRQSFSELNRIEPLLGWIPPFGPTPASLEKGSTFRNPGPRTRQF